MADYCPSCSNRRSRRRTSRRKSSRRRSSRNRSRRSSGRGRRTRRAAGGQNVWALTYGNAEEPYFEGAVKASTTNRKGAGFSYYSTMAEEGDSIVVFENVDPEVAEKVPRGFGSPYKEWDELKSAADDIRVLRTKGTGLLSSRRQQSRRKSRRRPRRSSKFNRMRHAQDMVTVECPSGHRWEVPDDPGTNSDVFDEECPTCGLTAKYVV